jgi:hypothetical protein
MRPRFASIDLATRVVLLPSLCLIGLVAYGATMASRHSRESLQEGATHAARVLADGAVSRLARTGRLPEAPDGTSFELIAPQENDLFSAPVTAASVEALARLNNASNEAHWLDTSGDGLLRLRYARDVSIEFPGDPAPRSGVMLVGVQLDGADTMLFDRAVARTAWMIFGGVMVFATMITCVRWMGVARLRRQDTISDAGRRLAGAAAEAEAAEQSAMTRLLREAEELAQVAVPPSGPSEEVENDLERLQHVAADLRRAADRLSAVAINCAVGAARSQSFDAELFDAADAIRQLADANNEAATQILAVCDANEPADDVPEAFARVGFLVKVAHEAAERQQAHREIAAQISAQLQPSNTQDSN